MTVVVFISIFAVILFDGIIVVIEFDEG